MIYLTFEYCNEFLNSFVNINDMFNFNSIVSAHDKFNFHSIVSIHYKFNFNYIVNFNSIVKIITIEKYVIASKKEKLL